MTEDRRETRRDIRMLQNESVWLQKAVFALRKAEAAREKLEDPGPDDIGPYAFMLGDRTVVLEDLEEALDQRIASLMDTIREMRKELK